MPVQKITVAPGEQVQASMINELLAEVRRLNKWTAAAPLQLSNNACGFQLSILSGATAIGYAKFEAHESEDSTSEYPTPDEECKFFPARLYPDATFDSDGECSEEIEDGEAGLEIFVGSFRGLFIPENTKSLVYLVNGVWWADYVRWKVKGKFSDTMSSGSTAELKVWAVSDPDSTSGSPEETDETITVHAWMLGSSQTVKPDIEVTAYYDVQDNRYYVDGAACGGSDDEEEE